MERCSNCGAATRPGAKFCTSCGTRLNLDQASTRPADPAWSDASPAQETQVATPAVETPEPTSISEIVTPPPHWDAVLEDPRKNAEESATGETATGSDEGATNTPVSAEEGSSWSGRWPSGTTDLDDGEAVTSGETVSAASPVETEPDTSEGSAAAASASAFRTPRRWSWGGKSDNEDGTSMTISPSLSADATSSSTNSPEGSVWANPVTNRSADEVTGTPAQDAGVTDTIDTGSPVDALPTSEGDDAGMVAGASAIGDADARQQATVLIDELRGLIWKIGEDESASDGASGINALRHVRGETPNFSDLRGVIEAVREDPRDIDALRDLGRQAGRLQELLESHDRLTSALDDAIRTMR